MNSGLSRIRLDKLANPLTLYKNWLSEASQCGIATILINLATVSNSGRVSNRTVVLREVLPDGSITFNARSFSQKARDIAENPQVASTILLIYSQNQNQITRQIRISGIAEKLPQEKSKSYFEKDSLPAKIRSCITENTKAIQWEDQKKKHDDVLGKVQEGEKLEMPDTLIAYKIVPEELQFYFSQNGEIADLLFFQKIDGEWTWTRLPA